MVFILFNYKKNIIFTGLGYTHSTLNAFNYHKNIFTLYLDFKKLANNILNMSLIILNLELYALIFGKNKYLKTNKKMAEYQIVHKLTRHYFVIMSTADGTRPRFSREFS